MQRLADIGYALPYAICEILFIKVTDHFLYRFVPVFIPYFLMNFLMAEWGQLPVFHGQVYQYSVALVRFFHFQPEEKFRSTIDRIGILAAAFNEYAYLTTRSFLGRTDSFNNTFLFFGGEEFFAFLPGKQFHNNWGCLVIC